MQAAGHPAAMPCPTCLVGDDVEEPVHPPRCDHLDAGATPDSVGVPPALCPTCGVTSLEWGLAVAMDQELADVLGLDRLARALGPTTSGGFGRWLAPSPREC